MTTFQGTIFREWVTRTTVMLRSSVLPGRWLSPYTLNPDVLMFLKKEVYFSITIGMFNSAHLVTPIES